MATFFHRRRAFLRTAAVTVAAALLAAGCAGGGQPSKYEKNLDPKNPVALEIWHYYNGPQKTAFDQLVTQFNETVGLEKGIIVEAFSQGNVTELTQKLLDSANKKVGAQEIPDIFAAYADTAYAIDQIGLVAELDPYLTEAEIAEYMENYIEEGRFDSKGSLKIFPVAKSTELLMLNKTDWDKFAAATGAALEDIGTIEGVTRTAQKYYEYTDSLTPAPGDGKAFFGRDAVANYFIIGCMQLGSEIFQVREGKCTLHLDEEIFRRLWDNFYVPHVKGHFAAYGKFRSDDVKTGDIIALVGSTSGATYFPGQVNESDTKSYPIEAAFFPAPCFEGGKPYAVQQGAGMVVTKSAAAQEYASVVFLKWFTDQQRNMDFSASSGYLPVKKAANDVSLLQKTLEAEGQGSFPAMLKASLPVAIEQVKSVPLYTNKAFGGGTQARAILEDSMLGRAKQDREAVEARLAEGATLEEASAPYCTDENFESWFTSFKQEMEQTVRQ